MSAFVKSGAELQPILGDPTERNQDRIAHLMSEASGSDARESVSGIAEELKTTMTQSCGIFRDDERLKAALHKVKELQARFKSARIMDKSSRFNTDLLAAIEKEEDPLGRPTRSSIPLSVHLAPRDRLPYVH